MGVGAIPVVLLILLVFLGWRIVYMTNKDLARVKAWRELARRALPFIVLTLMALSLFVVQSYQNQDVVTAWAIFFATAVILSNLYSRPTTERRANKAFRRGDYEESAAHYRALTEHKPLARHYAFLGAALGAAGHHEEGVEASSRAIELDPEYGLAYYNRALILRQLNHKGRAVKDLKRALESDLPRRFRGNAQGMIETLKK